MMRSAAVDSDTEPGSSASSLGSLSDVEVSEPRRQRKRQRVGSGRRGQDASATAHTRHKQDVSESGASTSGHAKYVPWTKEEDDNLRQLVEHMGAKNWSNIAAQMPSRTSKSCRLRWLNQLRPNVQTGSFTPDEDQVIIKAQAQLGNKWTAIAAMLPGRTDNAVKNRWNSALRKRVDCAGAAGVPGPAAGADSMQTDVKPSVAALQALPAHARQLEQPGQGQKPGAPPPPLQRNEQEQQQQQLRQQHQQALIAQLLAGSGAAFLGSGASPAFGQAAAQAAAAAAAGMPRPMPTLPPSSTAAVATGPPFQLPLPFMTLQPQMSASEAAAMLAAANSDMLKKVTEAAPIVHTVTVTSTAMVALTPPPTAMPLPAISAADAPPPPPPLAPSATLGATAAPQAPAVVSRDSVGAGAVQGQGQGQGASPGVGSLGAGAGAGAMQATALGQAGAQATPLLAAQQAMHAQLAVKLLQQHQQTAPPPATMAMVASTPPPVVMAIPGLDSKSAAGAAGAVVPGAAEGAAFGAAAAGAAGGMGSAGGAAPAVSWQLPGGGSASAGEQGMVASGAKAEGRAVVQVKEEQMQDVQAQVQVQAQAMPPPPPPLQQQQQQAQQAGGAPDIAQLLLMQRAVLQRQHSQSQLQQQHSQQQQSQQQSQQQLQHQQQQPHVPQMLPASKQPEASVATAAAGAAAGAGMVAVAAAPAALPAAASVLVPQPAPAALHQVHSITAGGSGGGGGASGNGGAASPQVGRVLLSLLESSAARSGVPAPLLRLVAAGGAEAVEHLMALGWGTLTAAAALRQQGVSDPLSAAQAHTAPHASADALLQWLRTAFHSLSHGHGPPHSQGHGHPHGQGQGLHGHALQQQGHSHGHSLHQQGQPGQLQHHHHSYAPSQPHCHQAGQLPVPGHTPISSFMPGLGQGTGEHVVANVHDGLPMIQADRPPSLIPGAGQMGVGSMHALASHPAAVPTGVTAAVPAPAATSTAAAIAADLMAGLGTSLPQHQLGSHYPLHHSLLDGSPLGSMSDLMTLCESSSFADLDRLAAGAAVGGMPGGRPLAPAATTAGGHPDGGAACSDDGAAALLHGHSPQAGGAAGAGLGTGLHHAPESPSGLGPFLGSDGALHRYMQHDAVSSPNLTHLLDGFGDIGDIVMHCALHG